MLRILNRLPDRKSVLSVFAWAAFLCYGWTLFASFWKVPSWSYYLTIGELLSMYAYSFIVNFLESLGLLLLALGIGLFLPRRWWYETFSVKGSILVIVLLGSIMTRLYLVRTPDDWEIFLYHQTSWWLGTAALLIGLLVLFSRFSWLQRGLEGLSDRVLTFLYLYLPLTALSIFVVVFRNI